MMQLRDVLLKATARQITWGEAAEIIGVSDRTIQKLRERLEREISTGVAEHKKRKSSQKRFGWGIDARIQELPSGITIVDEVSGGVLHAQPMVEAGTRRGSDVAWRAMESMQRIDMIASRHASMFQRAPNSAEQPEPKRRGMGIAPLSLDPVLRSH